MYFKIATFGPQYFILMQQCIISVILVYCNMRLILRQCSSLLTLIYLTAQQPGGRKPQCVQGVSAEVMDWLSAG